MRKRALFLILCWTLAGCTRNEPVAALKTLPPEPFTIVATVKQVMQTLVIPSSNIVFAAAGEAPQDEAGWLAAEDSALALAETSNLLMMNGRAKDREQWMRNARALLDASVTAVQAARARDADKLSEASDAIYLVCEGCHKQYMPKTEEPAPTGDKS
jgi:cytochrome c556